MNHVALAHFPAGIPDPQSNADTPLAELLVRYFALKNFTTETIRSYRREISHFFRSLELELREDNLGSLLRFDFSQLCNGAFTFVQSCLRLDPETNRPLNPRTFNRRKHALSSFFGYLMTFFGFPYNPLVYIKNLSVPTHTNTIGLTEDEAVAVLFHLQNQASQSETKARDFLIGLGLLLEALRRREIAELKWSDIQFEEGYVRLQQKGNREKLEPVPVGYLRLLKAFGKKYGKQSRYVFHPVQNNRCGELDKPISTEYIYKMIKRITQQIVPHKNLSPHSFRTTFATLGQKWNAEIKAIQHGMGHSRAEMVFYYHWREELEMNFIHTLGGFLDQKGLFVVDRIF